MQKCRINFSELEPPYRRITINKHLNALRDAGLVHSRKVGRETRYELHVMPLKELEDWLSFFDKHWTDHLVKLKAFVEKSKTE